MKSFQAKNLTDRSIVGLLMIFLGFTVVLVSGCKQAQSEANNSEDEVEIYETPDPLTALVIGDVDLGARMKRQWSARRDGELTIVDSTVAEFIDGGMVVPANVDLIVYPPSLLGELVNREILAQTPRDVWSSEELNKREILKHNRNLVVRHANKNWAMPLGGHNFAMFCNRELFEKSELEPPETWSKLDRALTKLEPALEELGNEKLKPKVDMPLGDGWAAHTYMARAASAIAHRGKLTTVFDRKTMKPLINQSGFVEVLESLKSIASERSVDLTPAEVYQLAYSGQSSIAFTWPAKGFGGDADDENTIPRVAPMPGGERWYDSKNLRWGKRSASEQFKIDTVGFAGMIGSVCVQSSNDQTAWEFLTWLSSKSIKPVILAMSVFGPAIVFRLTLPMSMPKSSLKIMSVLRL